MVIIVLLNCSDIIDAAFTSFPDARNPIVLKTLSNGMLMLELYHGKSLAFKDLSMSCAARILDYFLTQSNSKATFLIGINSLPTSKITFIFKLQHICDRSEQ